MKGTIFTLFISVFNHWHVPMWAGLFVPPVLWLEMSNKKPYKTILHAQCVLKQICQTENFKIAIEKAFQPSALVGIERGSGHFRTFQLKRVFDFEIENIVLCFKVLQRVY